MKREIKDIIITALRNTPVNVEGGEHIQDAIEFIGGGGECPNCEEHKSTAKLMADDFHDFLQILAETHVRVPLEMAPKFVSRMLQHDWRTVYGDKIAKAAAQDAVEKCQ